MAGEKYRDVDDALRAALALPSADELSLSAPPALLFEHPLLRDVSFVARGGMGSVYKAFDVSLAREVAIKVIRPGRLDESLRARFRREASALACLHHPHIVEQLRIEEREEHLLLVMEFVDGRSLRGFARRTASAEPVLAVMGLIGAALRAAHERGFVHRDIKPANIKVRRDGSPCLLDFGLARASSPRAGFETLTRPGDVLGTASYMAPEQARGERADALSDQYSFAVTTLEMCTSVHPHAQEALALRRELSTAVQEVLVRAMDPDPNKRFADMGALLTALDEALNRSPPGPRE